MTEQSETELLKRLAEMKEELNMKQRKLNKSRRTSIVKAHVRQKIQEQNLVKCSSPIKISVDSNSFMPAVIKSGLAMFDSSPIHEFKDCELQSANSCSTINPEEASSANHSHSHLAQVIPCISSDEEPMKTIESINQNSLKEVNRFLHHEEKNVHKLQVKRHVVKKRKKEINHSSDREELYENPKMSCNFKKRAENILERSRQESFCSDDFKHNNKKHNFRRSSNNLAMNCLQPAICRTLHSNEYSQLPVKDCHSLATIHKPLIPDQENFVNLNKEQSFTLEAAASGKSECMKNDGSGCLILDHQSRIGNTAESDTKLNSIVTDTCFQPKDLQNQIPQKGLIDVILKPHENSCDTVVLSKKSRFIDCVKDREICLNKMMIDVDKEHCEIVQSLTEMYVPDNSSHIGHCVNVKDFADTCLENSKQLVPYNGSSSNIDTTNDSNLKSENCEVLHSLCEPHNIDSVTKQIRQDPLDNTDFSRVDKAGNQNKKYRKESSWSNESDEDIVKGSQISMPTVKPQLCGRKQRLSLNADRSQNILSLTPSFESLQNTLQSFGSTAENVNNSNEHSVYKQELVTDSEFFNILGLTQNEHEALYQRETQAVNVSSQKKHKYNTSLNQENNNDCAGKVHITCEHNDLGTANVSNSLISTPLSDNVQLDGYSEHYSSKKKTLSKLNSEMHNKLDYAQTAIETFSSEDKFLEYTELDVIPYSQLELTEDFLSETQQSLDSLNKACHAVKHSRALVKRRSSRISSICFSHSNSSSYNGSLESLHFGYELTKAEKRSLTQQKRTASILSVFQFLVDEAKKNNSILEFELPISFNILKTRTESALKSPFFFEPQEDVGHNKESIEIEEEYSKNMNKFSSKYLFQNVVGQKVSFVNKNEQKQNVATIQEFIYEGSRKDVWNTYNVERSIHNSCMSGNIPDGKQPTEMLGDPETSDVICRDGEIASKDTVQEYFVENTDSKSKLIPNMTRSCVEKTHQLYSSGYYSTPLRQRNKHISKLGRRLANPSIAKKLFVAKNAIINAEFHGLSCKTQKDLLGNSADIKALPVENTNIKIKTVQKLKLFHEEEPVVCTSQKSTVSTCPNEMLTLPEIKTSSPGLGSSLIICETPKTPNALCVHSQSDSFNTSVTTPELAYRDSISLLSTPTNVFKAAQTFCANTEFVSPELNSSFLHLPVRVTPVNVTETSNHLSSSQSSRGGFSFTSTPKFTAENEMTCFHSGQGLKSCIEMSEEGAESKELKHLSSQPKVFSPSKLTSPYLSDASVDHMLSSDESYLSPAQIPVEGKHLHVMKECPTDLSLVSHAELSNASLDMSCLSSTCNNLITPWKQIPKTASTPILVLEKEDSRNHLDLPRFSPIIKRSRSKLSSSSRNTGHHALKFTGCFQSCAQDAVVSLLTGMLKTPENEEKYYIVSVQATSLTVWVEDNLCEWTAELDWRLCSEIHVMKACLLPRTDAVIAVVASGRDKRNLFATLFVYDWSKEDTARFNIPLLEQQNELKSPTQIELCPSLASELHIALTSDTQHTVGRVIFTDSMRAVQSLAIFGVHRGKLISFVTISGQVSANISLTGNQEVSIWNMKLGVVLKKIKLQSSLPCVTGLLAATSYKGVLLLDTIWRVNDGDCGGTIAVNPLTGNAQKIVKFSVPNGAWKSVESAKIDKNIVTAVSDKGSLGIWDKRSGVLLGHTKSKITTCSALIMFTKHLIVGEIYGCLHIYSAAK